MDAFILGLIGFGTSVITGVIGIGGGLLLIAILPFFLPIHAFMPLHGLNQITSNISRAYFGRKEIQFHVIAPFFIGSLMGVGLFTVLLKVISLSYIPLFIGTYILLSLWSRTFNEIISHYESYTVIGFFQTGLSVVVGTTGQLTMTKLLKEFHDKDKVVATSALLMSITHLLKIFVFIYFGFVFYDYWDVIISMVIGSILGSYVGTKLRHKLQSETLLKLLKIILSLLAIRSILSIM